MIADRTQQNGASVYPTPIMSLPFRHQTILAKLEFLQPTGSIKQRIAPFLIEALIQSGSLTDRTRFVVEATAGNTALALQNELKLRGYRAAVVAVLPEKMSVTKNRVLAEAGVIVRRVKFEARDSGDARNQGSPLLEATRHIANGLPDSILANQFFQESNVVAHEQATGLEITRQLHDPPDAIAIGAGTGGTLTGVGRAFRRAGWPTKIVLADPQGSVIGPCWLGRAVSPVKSIVEGIGNDFLPPLLDLSLIDEVISVDDKATLASWRDVVRRDLNVGSSTACVFAAARTWLSSNPSAKTCLVLCADHGSQYDAAKRVTDG